MNERDDPFEDIANAIYRLRVAFKKHGMEAPVSIELGSIRDKAAFLYLMPRDMIMAQPRMGETKADSQIVANVLGIEVLMPAEWRIDHDGKARVQ